jgi:hypothetical protein
MFSKKIAIALTALATITLPAFAQDATKSDAPSFKKRAGHHRGGKGFNPLSKLTGTFALTPDQQQKVASIRNKIPNPIQTRPTQDHPPPTSRRPLRLHHRHSQSPIPPRRIAVSTSSHPKDPLQQHALRHLHPHPRTTRPTQSPNVHPLPTRRRLQARFGQRLIPVRTNLAVTR